MEKQDKILNTCFDSFMKFGVKSVSMDDIAKSIGVSKKTIYSHFENKHDLVKSAVTKYVNEDIATIQSIIDGSINAIDAMISLATHVLKMLRNMSPAVTFDLQKYYPDIWRIVEDKHIVCLYDLIHKNILKGMDEGFYRTDINADIVAKFYIQLSTTVADDDQFPSETYQKPLVFKELIKYHLNSILTDEGKSYIKQQEII